MLSNYVEHTERERESEGGGEEEEEEEAHHQIQKWGINEVKYSVDLWKRLTCLCTLFN